MAFLDISFPRDVASGSVTVVGRRTDVVTVGAGYEDRNARWADSRRTFKAGLGIRSESDLAAVVEIFERARGRLHSFRFRDWSDWRSAPPGAALSATDQTIGTGDGAQQVFGLLKRYGIGADAYAREITKPEAGTVVVALDGVAQGGGWSVDPLTGLVTFDTAPGAGVAVSAGFAFDVPVRFAADELSIDWGWFREGAAGVGAAPDIDLVEVRE